MKSPFSPLLRRAAPVLAVFLAALPLGAEPTAVERHGRLSVKGNQIVDQSGAPVVLRGMSLFWSQWMGQYYNRNVVEWLRKDWHCTIVRAAMAVEPDGYLAKPDREKAKVKAVIQAALDQGLYVVIDWHDHNAHKHTAQAQEFFEEMAKTYGKHPNLIYELWNEPLKDHDWSAVIKPYHEAVIPKIRAHDPVNLIVCGTQSWSQDVDKAARDPLKARNVAYALHFYAATHHQQLRDKAAAALRSGAALMVTEWGTSEATGAGRLDQAETRAWWDFMEQHHLSWCNWALADKAETSAALKPGAAAIGGWSTSALSPSGVLVRDELRARNPAVSSSNSTPAK